VIRYRVTISLKGVAMSALSHHPSGPATRRFARHDVSVSRHDVHCEPVGGFAGTVEPDAPVGTFGNVRHLRKEARGAYAGDRNRKREGSFADHDVTAD
jgi:hypothetical protein